jgi:hypothetical protein
MLHVENGTIIDVALADDGTTVTVGIALRKQVKRARRGDDTYRFNLAVNACPREAFTFWFWPHAAKAGDNTPEHDRLIPPDDPDFKALYGLRNDAESFNSRFKRSLLVDRASSVGWERQLFDVLSYALLQNSLSWLAAQTPILTVLHQAASQWLQRWVQPRLWSDH